MSQIEGLTAALADRYRIERELGQGGMATVYLAEDLRHERKVAIKVMRPELAAVIGADRFLQEIKVTANLQHPHILGLIDSGRVEGTVFYVMPFVEGESLRDRLSRERQLSIDDAVRLTREVAGALDYAHRHGVIHRDIKPENILLHDGQALVADFGIALAVNAAGSGRMTETGMSLGTPAYMSPEQAMGERSLDARTDLYALGCVLYEMLVGEPPFTGPSAQAVLAKVITEKAPSATLLRESVPRHVTFAIQVALAKLPADRFATAAAFADALARPGVLDSQYQTAADALAITMPRARWFRDLRLLILAAIAVVATGVALWSLRRPSSEVAWATARFNFEPRRDQAIRTVTGRTVAISPDGSRIVYVGAAAGAQTMLHLRHLGDMAITPVPGTAGGSQPFFSPDGNWLGYFTGEAIKKVPVAGGPALTIARVTGIIRGARWGRDGTIVFSDGSRLLRVSEAGGDPLQVRVSDSTLHLRWPEQLPDGKAILASSADHKIYVIEIETGKATLLISEGDGPHYLPNGQLLYGHQSQAILAVPFDVKRRVVTGPPVPALQEVQVFSGGAVQFVLSDNGVAVYRAGGEVEKSLVSVDSTGRETLLPAKPGVLSVPRVSPDGKRIAYELSVQAGTNGDIYSLDLGRGTSSRITFEGAGGSLWSPDGRSIAYAKLSSVTGFDIYQRKADGSGAEDTLYAGPGNQRPKAWATDGRLLVEQWSADSSSFDLVTLQPVPQVEPYLRENWATYQATLSPDRHWSAYTSRESGREEIYVRAFPAAAGKWQISEGGGSEPLWSPDGRSLHYRADDSLVTVAVRTAPSFEVAGRRSAISWPYDTDGNRDYDIFPDGKHFVAVKLPQVATITVATNWLTELRERLAGLARPERRP